ncbi:MAG: hypothetical protein ACREL7_02535, partial [Longimicrobiales bacterium]
MAVWLEAIARWVGGVDSTAARATGILEGARGGGPVRPGGRGTASGAAALIEVEVRAGLGLGRIIGGRLSTSRPGPASKPRSCWGGPRAGERR